MKSVIVTAITMSLSVMMFLSHYGLFAQAVISEKEMGPYMLIYEKNVGDYSSTAILMDNVHKRLIARSSITTAREFRLFYDNPRRSKDANLRCIAGCILEKKDGEKFAKLEKSQKSDMFPASKSVVCEFPFEGKLSGIIGALKVYPKLNNYMKFKGYRNVPIMEVFDMQNRKLYYVASVGLDSDTFDSYLE
jgi:hypothetical protein